MNELATRRCKPCEGGVDPLQPSEVENMLKLLSGWTLKRFSAGRVGLWTKADSITAFDDLTIRGVSVTK